MSDHACTAPKRVYRTTSAPVSTTRTPSLPQDPATRRTPANISTAIRLTSQWIRPVAITPYVHIRVCFRKNFVYHYGNTFQISDVIAGRMKVKTHLKHCGIDKTCLGRRTRNREVAVSIPITELSCNDNGKLVTHALVSPSYTCMRVVSLWPSSRWSLFIFPFGYFGCVPIILF